MKGRTSRAQLRTTPENASRAERNVGQLGPGFLGRYGGGVASVVGGGLTVRDAWSNDESGIAENGLDVDNGLQVAGGVLGVSAGFAGLLGMSSAVPYLGAASTAISMALRGEGVADDLVGFGAGDVIERSWKAGSDTGSGAAELLGAEEGGWVSDAAGFLGALALNSHPAARGVQSAAMGANMALGAAGHVAEGLPGAISLGYDGLSCAAEGLGAEEEGGLSTAAGIFGAAWTTPFNPLGLVGHLGQLLF